MMVLPSCGASSSSLVCCRQRMRCWCAGCGCHCISNMAGAFVGELGNSHCDKAPLATPYAQNAASTLPAGTLIGHDGAVLRLMHATLVEACGHQGGPAALEIFNKTLDLQHE